jgi:hypothetical protein
LKLIAPEKSLRDYTSASEFGHLGTTEKIKEKSRAAIKKAVRKKA